MVSCFISRLYFGKLYKLDDGRMEAHKKLAAAKSFKYFVKEVDKPKTCQNMQVLLVGVQVLDENKHTCTG